MSHRVLVGSLLLSWAVGFVHTMSQMVFTVTLPFCGPNVVDDIFCDLPLVIKLGCTETYVLELLVIADSGLLSFTCFTLLLISYTVILVTVRCGSSGNPEILAFEPGTSNLEPGTWDLRTRTRTPNPGAPGQPAYIPSRR
ncbi:Olfactory receptor 4L1 [Sciurus carolinensis]|uniref:Olfactory receptor 4L1 n=1 Tax=Sciurus carolinensis TaxID=30640 RepID=A0AA41SWB9_SCICA|nr:Olfactory receptor 4L1 [Sciurus carolinensis]